MADGFDRLDTPSHRECETYARQGFLVVENVLGPERIAALRERFPLLFAGKFDTGIFPDEWYWREGMSLPDVTRHMANAWKADLTVARLVLSSIIARYAAALAGLDGARLGQDTIWWKTALAKPITLHQDTSFMDFLDPPSTVTCWITLDDTHRDAGTLEYIAGSHRWPLTSLPDAFHATDDHRAQMRAAALANHCVPAEPTYIEVPAGSCVFHCGEIWHGSAANTCADRVRRSIGIHLLPENAQFSDRHGGYIYRRYQRTGDPNLDESFFPILWSRSGRATEWTDEYCRSGRRQARPASQAA